MRSLFGYQRGGPVRGGAYREQPNLPSRGDPVQDAVDTAVGGRTKPFPSDQYGKWGHGVYKGHSSVSGNA